MLNYSHRGHILQISNLKDSSSPLAWDCSSWVRTYALFLEERLECFTVLRYDIEAERLLKNPQGATKILKESFKIYCAINDGIINLVDMFFEMSKFDAAKALEIYKRAGQQAEILAEFYEFCKALELARNFQFPTLRQPPPSFLATMEEYIKELPRVGSASSKNLEFEEKNLLTYKEEDAPPETQEPAATKEEKQPDPEPEEQPPEPTPEPELEPEPPATTGDLLGLEEEINPVAAEIDQNNELALAIMQPGDGSKPLTCMDLLAGGSSGWELTRVTTPSNNTNHVGESKLAGGFDKLLLNSLYEDRARQQQIAFTRILWWCRNCCQSFQQE